MFYKIKNDLWFHMIWAESTPALPGHQSPVRGIYYFCLIYWEWCKHFILCLSYVSIVLEKSIPDTNTVLRIYHGKLA